MQRFRYLPKMRDCLLRSLVKFVWESLGKMGAKKMVAITKGFFDLGEEAVRSLVELAGVLGVNEMATLMSNGRSAPSFYRDPVSACSLVRSIMDEFGEVRKAAKNAKNEPAVLKGLPGMLIRGADSLVLLRDLVGLIRLTDQCASDDAAIQLACTAATIGFYSMESDGLQKFTALLHLAGGNSTLAARIACNSFYSRRRDGVSIARSFIDLVGVEALSRVHQMDSIFAHHETALKIANVYKRHFPDDAVDMFTSHAFIELPRAGERMLPVIQHLIDSVREPNVTAKLLATKGFALLLTNQKQNAVNIVDAFVTVYDALKTPCASSTQAASPSIAFKKTVKLFSPSSSKKSLPPLFNPADLDANISRLVVEIIESHANGEEWVSSKSALRCKFQS